MLNSVHIQGRLTDVPEIKHTATGAAFATFVLASDSGRKTPIGDKIVRFIDCIAWRNHAEFVHTYLHKGQMVIVEGELSTRSYEDKNGNRRKSTEVIVEAVYFFDARQTAAPPADADDGAGSPADGEIILNDADLPF